MEGNELFCEVEGCTERAPYDFTWGQSRKAIRTQRLCDQHAHALMDEYSADDRIGKGNRATLEGATCFDIELVLISQIHDEQVIYLREVGGSASIPILVGGVEAYSIAVRLIGIQSPRPLTHDAMFGAITALGGSVRAVLIDRLEEKTYHAKAHVNQNGKQVAIDMRPSDAFILAIASDSPIFFIDELAHKMAVRDPS